MSKIESQRPSVLTRLTTTMVVPAETSLMRKQYESAYPKYHN